MLNGENDSPRQPQGEQSFPQPGAYGMNRSTLSMQILISPLFKDHLKKLTNTEYSPVVPVYGYIPNIRKNTVKSPSVIWLHHP